jgi:glycosyltransferase involved in cell wall biosynthesis
MASSHTLDWHDSEFTHAPAPTVANEDYLRPLTIVHVITRLLQGGAEENTASTCLHQAACGHHVTLVHGPGANPMWATRLADRVRLVSVDSLVHPISPVADFHAIFDLSRLYRRLHPDVVHTHESKAGIVGRIAAALAGVPVIVHTIHIAPFEAVNGGKRRFYVAAERICARISNLLIAVSRGMQQAYISAHIGGSVPIPVIHSGMLLEHFSKAIAPTDWRRRIGGWDARKRPRIILKMAAFEPRKRQMPLLRAMAAGLRERDDVCLLFGGEGPDRARCEAEAHALGIADKVRFVGHDPAPWELIALADLCVHASEREGLPRSAVQSIAGGKPIVVAALPGIEELVVDGVNGAIARSDDLSDLAERVFALLDSPDQLLALQCGARATDVSSWEEELMGERMDKAYSRAFAVARRPIMTIEFLGLPGAGKTAIARELLALLREKRSKVAFSRDRMGVDLPLLHRSLRRLALVARVFIRLPLTMCAAAHKLTPQRSRGREALKTWWNFWSVLAMQSLPSRSKLLVADEGLAQAMWTARVHHGPDAAPAESVFRHLDQWLGETLFIHVDAPGAVARERLATRRRHTSRFQDADRIDDPALWKRGEAVIEQVAQDIAQELERRNLYGRMLRISSDGADSPLDRARHIHSYLCTTESRANTSAQTPESEAGEGFLWAQSKKPCGISAALA